MGWFTSILADDWRILQDMVLVAAPLQTMTVLSGEQYVTYSQIIPLVHGLFLEVTKKQETLTTEVSQIFCLSLLSAVEKHLFPYESRSILKLTTFFDPRFKKVAFRLSEKAEEARKQAESEIAAFLKRQEQRYSVHHSSGEATTGPSSFRGELIKLILKEH